VSRKREHEALVAVADANPILAIYDDGVAVARWCVLCRVHATDRDGPQPHAEGCGWRRANEIIGRRPVSQIPAPGVTPRVDNRTEPVEEP
jgi:hypothetical protein